MEKEHFPITGFKALQTILCFLVLIGRELLQQLELSFLILILSLIHFSAMFQCDEFPAKRQ